MLAPLEFFLSCHRWSTQRHHLPPFTSFLCRPMLPNCVLVAGQHVCSCGTIKQHAQVAQSHQCQAMSNSKNIVIASAHALDVPRFGYFSELDAANKAASSSSSLRLYRSGSLSSPALPCGSPSSRCCPEGDQHHLRHCLHDAVPENT